jgi:hypothetical protein
VCAVNRHEVAVGFPARDDVHVDVTGEPGAGDLPLVDADVEAVGPVLRAQRTERAPEQAHERERLAVVEVGQRGHMTVR